jgi:hypothetical protein
LGHIPNNDPALLFRASNPVAFSQYEEMLCEFAQSLVSILLCLTFDDAMMLTTNRSARAFEV